MATISGVIVFVVAILFLAVEDKRLVGKPESGGKHHHDDGYLVTGRIDTQLVHRPGRFVEQGIEYLVDILVQVSGNTQQQDGIGVVQDSFKQFPVENPPSETELRQQHQQGRRAADQIRHQDVPYPEIGVIEPGDTAGQVLLQVGADDEEKEGS